MLMPDGCLSVNPQVGGKSYVGRPYKLDSLSLRFGILTASIQSSFGERG